MQCSDNRFYNKLQTIVDFDGIILIITYTAITIIVKKYPAEEGHQIHYSN